MKNYYPSFFQDFFAFQCISIAVAVLAVVCFKVTGSLKHQKKGTKHDDFFSLVVPSRGKFQQNVLYALKLMKQIVLAILMCPVVFFIILLHRTSLLECDVILQLLVILSGNMIVKIGAAAVVMYSFVASIIASTFVLFFGHNQPYVIICFMFFDSIAVHSVAPLFQVLLADFIDEDATHFSRQKPISSTVYSLAALLVRPAQSVAPFVIVMILTQYGYKEYQADSMASVLLVNCMFYVLCFTTMLTGAVQLLIFYPFCRQCMLKRNKSDILV
ncbi:unnamed protein product [Gongylonema pulchrum]|uniref:Uncharacterized protein n=1 Tax=Gongylonema pulchrum TaxID=637853 RepID=A0A3P7P1D5_9BILA|nr:unnamed protein product [Gongylonema pulchrum]